MNLPRNDLFALWMPMSLTVSMSKISLICRKWCDRSWSLERMVFYIVNRIAKVYVRIVVKIVIWSFVTVSINR